ncbi:hypothetical protein YT1_0868 [Rhodococcus ruber]|nr:hypothetical protein YT1_0868 [Rhodococcus ruber]
MPRRRVCQGSCAVPILINHRHGNLDVGDLVVHRHPDVLP